MFIANTCTLYYMHNKEIWRFLKEFLDLNQDIALEVSVFAVRSHFSCFIKVNTLFFSVFIHFCGKRFQDGVHTSFV